MLTATARWVADVEVQVSTEFIQSCLGPNLKYSCCLYPTGKESLEEAELLMLESYCVKAKLVDGMDILDLGCGWGSLSLFLAKVSAWPYRAMSCSDPHLPLSRNTPTPASPPCPTLRVRSSTLIPRQRQGG
jgi:cyclopropane fatty-acyl-phospholipid synthase-like methyltransferase